MISPGCTVVPAHCTGMFTAPGPRRSGCEGDIHVDQTGRPISRKASISRIGPYTTALANCRSEERRVGKGCVRTCWSRRTPHHSKKKELHVEARHLKPNTTAMYSLHT